MAELLLNRRSNQGGVMNFSALPQRIETVVIGAGQAGLAISYHLSRAGQAHLVLEKASLPANAWRNQRWDSFTLVTPNFQVRMPGAEYAGQDPYGFMSRAQVIEYLEAYAARFRLPVRCGVEVRSVERVSGEYRLVTSAGTLDAENVVVATGLYQSPKIPHFSAAFPGGIQQLHSMQYRNPASLQPGAILVIGTGQSGAQIAEELYQSGRKVFLSIGQAGRVPRRYRGRDINDWLTRMGLFDTKVQELKSAAEKFAAHPQISGKNGGESLNLHQFARDGVQLLGHVRGCSGGQLLIAPDLHETLAKVDQFEIDTVRKIDEYIARAGLSAPPETLTPLREGYAQPQITELNLTAHGIGSVIWATGYAFDFSLVRLPVVDSDGYPIQNRGVTRFEGLYFLGLPWLDSRRSGLLFGVGEDAAFLAEHMATRAAAFQAVPRRAAR
jgi:putative flavoprotein involved in K+ transport